MGTTDEPCSLGTEDRGLAGAEIPEVDSRSFRVFELEGDRLLFDRFTGTTSELSELAFEVLSRIQVGDSVVDAVSTCCCGEESARDVLGAIDDLKRRGFFRFWTARSLTDDELTPLWEHRPRRIQLLMAEGCNLGCRYCYQWRNGTNQKHTLMPWDVARDAVNYLVWRSGGRNDLQITFFGGEPLLNYSMVRRVVQYCKSIEERSSKRFTFELITNGTLLEKEVVDFLVKHRFLLFISIDGWKEMHDYNRPSLVRGMDMYQTILNNALYANDQYVKHKLPTIKVRANLTGKFHDAEAVAKYFESLGFGLIGIGAIEPLPHGDPSPAALNEEQMEALSDRSWQVMKEALHEMENGRRPGPYLRRKINQATSPMTKRAWHGITCGVARNTTIVDNRGNLYPCHRYAEMKAFEIGNVKTGMDREKTLRYYRKINGHSTESCQDCWIRDYCSGGCAWLLSDKDGKIHNPTSEECMRRRRSMEQGLWMRSRLRKVMPDRFGEQDGDGLELWDWDADGTFDPRTPGCKEEPIQSTALPVLPIYAPTEMQSAMPSPCGSCNASDSAGGCACGSEPRGSTVRLVPMPAAK